MGSGYCCCGLIVVNTSGIISRKDAAITNPKDLVGKKYGTWMIRLSWNDQIDDEKRGWFNQVARFQIVIQIPLLRNEK